MKNLFGGGKEVLQIPDPAGALGGEERDCGADGGRQLSQEVTEKTVLFIVQDRCRDDSNLKPGAPRGGTAMFRGTAADRRGKSMCTAETTAFFRQEKMEPFSADRRDTEDHQKKPGPQG